MLSRIITKKSLGTIHYFLFILFRLIFNLLFISLNLGNTFSLVRIKYLGTTSSESATNSSLMLAAAFLYLLPQTSVLYSASHVFGKWVFSHFRRVTRVTVVFMEDCLQLLRLQDFVDENVVGLGVMSRKVGTVRHVDPLPNLLLPEFLNPFCEMRAGFTFVP